MEKVREAFYTTYVVASDDGRMGATAKQLQNTKRKAFARNLERVQFFHLIGALLVGETQLIWPATFADRGRRDPCETWGVSIRPSGPLQRDGQDL